MLCKRLIHWKSTSSTCVCQVCTQPPCILTTSASPNRLATKPPHRSGLGYVKYNLHVHMPKSETPWKMNSLKSLIIVLLLLAAVYLMAENFCTFVLLALLINFIGYLLAFWANYVPIAIIASCFFRITDVTPAEAGQYICSATNDAGTAEAIAHITVNTEPTLSVTPDQETIIKAVNDHLQLICYASGFPQPTVNWVKATSPD